VHFRYRLEGWDTEWHDPGARRQSFYTNLRPGSYHFSVVASNDDGLWNDKGASVEFSIKPAYYQTWWFKLACGALAILLAQSVYIYRLRQAKVKIQQTLATRLGERERIARELHDTLLQGIQGLVLKFHAFANALPAEGTLRQTMERVLAQAREVIEEGRGRVRDLRGKETSSTNLVDQLRLHGKSFLQSSPSELNMSVIGHPVALNPIAADEAFSIGREAITNAFLHAEAQHIEVEITYGPGALVLRIRDDGKGMEPATLDAGRIGHWGMAGMRERARSLGVELKIWSRSSYGTEIELTVPAAVAYVAVEAAQRRSWFERLLSRFHPTAA
jgi:signal transduction histidine kinase